MCINPSGYVWVLRGPKWQKVARVCGDCWRCRANRQNDYVGRCMAEAAVSKETCVITLTYAPRDDLADKIITPRHFQLFIKLLRRSGHKIRYLVCAEMGPLKGRVHFHALLFFSHLAPSATGEVPAYGQPASFCREIPNKEMCHISEWPHGHIVADWGFSEKSARYVCKYILKDVEDGDRSESWFSLSKKPALGHGWFMAKAQMSRDLGAVPHSFEYLPPGGRADRAYLMTGATRRDYLAAVAEARHRPRMSEWVGKTFDKHDLAARKQALERQSPAAIEAAYDKFYADRAEQDATMRSMALERLFRKSADGTISTAQLRAVEGGRYDGKAQAEGRREAAAADSAAGAGQSGAQHLHGGAGDEAGEARDAGDFLRLHGAFGDD